jgi:hypothetical protein
MARVHCGAKRPIPSALARPQGAQRELRMPLSSPSAAGLRRPAVQALCGWSARSGWQVRRRRDIGRIAYWVRPHVHILLAWRHRRDASLLWPLGGSTSRPSGGSDSHSVSVWPANLDCHGEPTSSVRHHSKARLTLTATPLSFSSLHTVNVQVWLAACCYTSLGSTRRTRPLVEALCTSEASHAILEALAAASCDVGLKVPWW